MGFLNKRLNAPFIKGKRSSRRIGTTNTDSKQSLPPKTTIGTKPTISLPKFQFDPQNTKVVIGVSFYRHPELTKSFMNSIKETTGEYSLYTTEDGSIDQEHNLKIIRESALFPRVFADKENKGFIKSQNRMMEEAFSEGADIYVSVNSDIIFTDKDWLVKMLKYMAEKNIGLASPALIEGEDRYEYEMKTTYEKELAGKKYVTGACLFISKQLYEEIGSFDEIYEQGYCEDPDYSYKANSIGYNIGINKNVLLTHLVNVTFGAAEARIIGNKNGKILVGRWGRSSLPAILFTTPWNLNFGEAAGSNGLYHFLQYLAYRAKVYYYPSGPSILLKETRCPSIPLEGFKITQDPLEEIGNRNIDLIIGSWWWSCEKLIRAGAAKGIKNCIYTVDIHYAREELMQDYQWELRKPKELELYNLTDALTVVSKGEIDILPGDIAQKTFFTPHRTVPPILPPERPCKNRIGYLAFWPHSPNIKCLDWFIRNVWPEVLKRLSNVELILFGMDTQGVVVPYTKVDKVRYGGHADTLADLFSNVDITIAPMLYGAGVNGKVVDSIQYGRPVVMTERTGKALGLELNACVSDDPIKQAEAIVELLSNWYFYNNQIQIQKMALDKSYGYKTYIDGINNLFRYLDIKLGGVE